MYRTALSMAGVALAGVALALPAWAGEIYRCTDAQGRIEYRDEPCSRAAGQTGSAVTLPPLNIVRDLDQSAGRAAANAAAARTAEAARREAQQRAGGVPSMNGGATPVWQIPGGLPVQGSPDVKPEPPIVIPPVAPAPPPSVPANATSAGMAAATGNPTAAPAIAPKSPPAVPANAASGAAAAATGVAGR